MTIEDIIEGVIKKPKIPSRPPEEPQRKAPPKQPEPVKKVESGQPSPRLELVEERLKLMDQKLDVIQQQLKNIFDTLESWRRY